MKKIAFILLAILCAAISVWADGVDLRIWFDAPATQFTQALPLGNGRLGAMVYGGVDEERLVLNEISLWSGGKQDADRPDAAQYLPEIRRLLLAGKNVEAEKLVYAHFTCQGRGSGRGHGKDVPYGSYQILGNLRLAFQNEPGETRGYRRELNPADATARVEYELGGVKYSRTVFVSAPDEVIVIRLTASRPGRLSFDAKLDRPERATITADGDAGLLMSGQLHNGADGSGMKYAARLRVLNRGGAAATVGQAVQVRGAEEVILLVAAATDYQGFAGRKTADPLAASANDLQKAAAKNHGTLLSAHLADFQRYFNRVGLNLGPANVANVAKPTPARLRDAAAGAPDPGLAALYFQFGRYLLISSSRPGGLPANLQGIWADTLDTPWNADWHLNVNVQMNYWPAEVANLSELHQPLFALIASLQEPGARTAKLYYNARGWVAHVMTNPWGFTAPGEGASWGSTTSGSAWLCQHLWDHYLFTRDREFLKWAYPIMKGSAQFYADMLIEEPKNKWLVTAPANSPENAFRLPDGKTAHVCMGPTVDMQLLRYLFDACIESARLLGVDAEFRKELRTKRARLAPTRIGSDGRVMEWLEEYAEPEPTHRHISHLWGLYPGAEITADGTPQLAAAARKTLERRGDISTGWSLAHKINFWARLGDGDRAQRLLALLLSPVDARRDVEGVRFAGGSYDNLFDAHPPFQIDGNFGATAGIAEMLLQSHEDVIRLLPALPSAWLEGSVKGLRARGGYTLDINWTKGKLTTATLRSELGGACKLRYGGKTIQVRTKRGGSYRLDDWLERGGAKEVTLRLATPAPRTNFKFDFGQGTVAPGYTQVLPGTVYSKELGYGFEPGAKVSCVERGKDARSGDPCTSDQPFFFSVALPEGNYNVTVTFGDATAATTTTVKAELRRLMLEKVETAPGKFTTRTFTVNVRTPQIAGGGEVRLKDRERASEVWAWDEKLTLEFNNTRPAVCAVEITRADGAPTVYLLGDSTVADQPLEPYNSRGQMLPRFFQSTRAVPTRSSASTCQPAPRART